MKIKKLNLFNLNFFNNKHVVKNITCHTQINFKEIKEIANNVNVARGGISNMTHVISKGIFSVSNLFVICTCNFFE